MRYQHGGDIYTTKYELDFSANIGPFGVNPAALKAAKDAMDQIHAYPDVQCRELKKALAESIGLSEENFVIGNGAAEIIFSLVLARKPEKALVLSPTFAEYEQALQTVGCEIYHYDRQREQSFLLDDRFLDELSGSEDYYEILFLCNPDNPTGTYLTKEYMDQVLGICEEREMLLVVDESFIEFVVDEESDTMSSYVSEHPSLFVLRSFTKMYGLPGLRLGYGMTSDQKLIEQIEDMRQPWSVSTPAQSAGVAVVGEKDWANKTRNYVKKQRVYLEMELQKLGFEVYPSASNFILFYSEKPLMNPLKEKGILIRDCSNFRGLGEGYYRIAVKREEENKVLIQALKDIMR